MRKKKNRMRKEKQVDYWVRRSRHKNGEMRVGVSKYTVGGGIKCTNQGRYVRKKII